MFGCSAIVLCYQPHFPEIAATDGAPVSPTEGVIINQAPEHVVSGHFIQLQLLRG